MKQKWEILCTPGGDDHLAIYYSDEVSTIANMMTLVYRRAVLEAKIPGITEVDSSEASLMVHFDPMRIRYQDVLNEVKEIEKEYADPGKWIWDSRLFEIPIWFDDPWSMECYLAHKECHPLKDGTLSNFAYCARYLRLSPEEYIERLVSPQYLIPRTGFAIGFHGLVPLEERKDFLMVPKYETGRLWTPARTFAGGGTGYCIYPYPIPGGYQMLGSSAVPVTRLERAAETLPPLRENVTLASPGDRFKLRAISKEEYEEIRAKVLDGTYEYKVTYQKWEVKKWIDDPRGYKGS